jgi:hypothetical protein
MATPAVNLFGRFFFNQASTQTRKYMAKQSQEAAEEIISGAYYDKVEQTTGIKVNTPPPQTPGGLFGAGVYSYGKSWWNSGPSGAELGGHQAAVHHLSGDPVFGQAMKTPHCVPVQQYVSQKLDATMGGNRS